LHDLSDRSILVACRKNCENSDFSNTLNDTWLKSGNKRQAFRQAQQQIRDKYKLPEYWGAFVMVGE